MTCECGSSSRAAYVGVLLDMIGDRSEKQGNTGSYAFVQNLSTLSVDRVVRNDLLIL